MNTGLSHRNSALRRLVVALLVISVIHVVGGCGKKDAEPAARPAVQSMVPAGVDTAAVDSTAAAMAGGQAADTSLPAAGEPDALKPVARQGAAATPARRPAVATTGGSFSLQLGSFSSADNARVQAERIQQLGYRAAVEVATLGGQTYHRVVLRGLADRNEAERLGERIRSELGITYLIRQK